MNKHEYVYPTNWIKKITRHSIEFAVPRGEVFLNRTHQGLRIWSITNEGVRVHKEYARAYNLSFPGSTTI